MESLILLLLCCCCTVGPVLGLFYYLYYFARLSRKGNTPDNLSNIWYRIILITPRGFYALFISAIVILLGASSVDFSIISSVGIFLIITFVVLYVYSWIINIYIFLRNQTLEKDTDLIEVRNKLNVLKAGQEVTQDILMRVPMPIGMFMKVSVVAPLRLGGEVRTVNVENENGLAKFTAEFDQSRRGIYEIGPIFINYTDLLGFTNIRIARNKLTKVKIYPVLKRLRKLAWFSPSQKIGNDQAIKRMINTDDFFGIKEYKRGDDTRRINWKSTAKQKKLMLKVPEVTEVEVGNISIFIDNVIPQILKANEKGVQDILDRMVEIASTVIDFTLKESSEVQVYYFKKGKFVSQKYQKTRLEEWLDELTSIEWVEASFSSLNSALDQMNKQRSKGQGLFMISSSLDEFRVKAINDSNYGSLVNVMYVDPFSFLSSVKQNTSNRILKAFAKIFISSPYLEQKTFEDNFAGYFLKREIPIEESKINIIRTKSQSIISIIKSKFNYVKIFRKEDDFVNILEKEI